MKVQIEISFIPRFRCTNNYLIPLYTLSIMSTMLHYFFQYDRMNLINSIFIFYINISFLYSIFVTCFAQSSAILFIFSIVGLTK